MRNKNVLVVAPHPDDETLGCGGTLLLLKNKGYRIHWLIVTSISEEMGFSKEKVKSRTDEIEKVARAYGFERTIHMGVPASRVDEIPYNQLVSMISDVFKKVKPNLIFLPFYNDVHTDHKVITEASLSCTKWFRFPYVNTVLFYETISETDFNINSSIKKFEPNVFIDISEYIGEKLRIMNVYESEMDEFPFPRSDKALKSLAYLRGSQCGAQAAEAFELQRANVSL